MTSTKYPSVEPFVHVTALAGYYDITVALSILTNNLKIPQDSLIDVGKVTSCKADRSIGTPIVLHLVSHVLQITKNSFKISSFYLDFLKIYEFHRQTHIKLLL
jgi:hypothetical protein